MILNTSRQDPVDLHKLIPQPRTHPPLALLVRACTFPHAISSSQPRSRFTAFRQANKSNAHHIITIAVHCPNSFGTLIASYKDGLANCPRSHIFLHPATNQAAFQWTTHTSGPCSALGKLHLDGSYAAAEATCEIRGELRQFKALLSSAN
jgi:hypothetical protein